MLKEPKLRIADWLSSQWVFSLNRRDFGVVSWYPCFMACILYGSVTLSPGSTEKIHQSLLWRCWTAFGSFCSSKCILLHVMCPPHFTAQSLSILSPNKLGQSCPRNDMNKWYWRSVYTALTTLLCISMFYVILKDRWQPKPAVYPVTV